MREIELPYLGRRKVMKDPKRPGHWLWLSAFGWHDCATQEDELINDKVAADSTESASENSPSE